MAMRVKQIELNGFKSFADRKTFQLHNGITCIVGPNGCGKSNVVDAFRWVLGEQSVKSLRGEKMEEVIFQGSATVKQKGMAEVALILSHTGGKSPESENGNGNSSSEDKIVVSRRLYRSGESEYYLNKRQCRLKDIKDIFLDTGLDVKSYSILDQGRVSEIINTKPLDRRFLIEEIAGVMKYKVRKTEALSKLESSKQNLQRINDIVYEVKRQINSLDRQVKKAERYKRLIEELKTLELRVAKREHIKFGSALSSLLSGIDRIREIDSLKRSELSSMEAQIETKRLELADKEKALSEFENNLYSKEKSISESEKNSAVLKTDIENRRTDISRLANQQKEFDAKKEEFSRKTGELNTEASALSSSMTDLTEELREKKEVLSGMEMTIGDKESEIEDKRKDLFRIAESLSHAKNEIHKFQSSHETLKYRESASIKDMESIREAVGALEKTITGAEEGVRAAAGRRAELLSEKETLIAKAGELNALIESKRNLLARERETLASNTSRLNSLKELIVDRSLMDFMSEAACSTRAGQTTGQQEAAPAGVALPAGYLVLSDVISAGSDYEKAIEAALSEKVNSIILSTIEGILSAIDIIKEKQLGRTAIFYTGYNKDSDGSSVTSNELKDNNASEDPSLATRYASLIGRASDFITFEDTDIQGTAGKILENTYIVRDLRSAIELRGSGPFNGASLATLDGEFIDRDGIIFAGQGKDILKRKREIKELQKTILEQQLLIENTENELNTANASLTGLKELLRGIENSIVDIEKEVSLIDHSLASQKDDLERKRRKLSFLDTEIAAIASEMESLESLMHAKAEEISRIERQRDAVNEEITVIQNSLASVKAEYEEARTHLTDLRLTIASYKEKTEALQRESASIAHTIEELERSKESAAREIQETERKLTESLAELQDLEEAIKTLVVAVDSMRRERAERKEAIDSENQALVEEAHVLKRIRTEIDASSQELANASSKAVEYRLRIENIETSIMQKYGLEIGKEEISTGEPGQQEGAQDSAQDVPLDEAAGVTQSDPLADETGINQLNEKIRDLGPVNLGTIEEYEELKGRYDFLTKQQQDLTMSIAELEEAISRINTSTKRKLREAYDALRAKFIEVFTTLFGGGKADLILTDEENILESGVDIIAQPPGKKLQNLNLLSGGEKALTSLTLLFAGFLIKPSPLCILDEVDAPLDESNTVRFAQMIKGLSNETQFIVITHNRTSMEVADYIYGITMEEPGSSKAISLQFSDVENIN